MPSLFASPVARRCLAVGGATAAVVAVAVGCMQSRPVDAAGPAKPVAALSSKPIPPELFSDWPKGKAPVVALVLTGEQHSYLKFCGCSSPQLGGFERRYNFIAKLKEKGWPVQALDLGDVVYYKQGVHEQSLLKYETAMQALEKLNYAGIGLGKHDFDLPLIDGLARFTLQKPDAYPKVLAGNLQNRQANFPLNNTQSMIQTGVMIGGTNGQPKIGACAVVGPSVAAKINQPNVAFAQPGPAIQAALQHFDAGKADLRVLLYQGDPKLDPNAAEYFSKFNVVLTNSPEEEPPARPLAGHGTTTVVNVGHKGRYVGVVGVFPGAAGQPYDLKYQLVALGEEYETDADKEKDHPILKLLEGYTKQLKDGQFLAKHPQIPHPVQVQSQGTKVAFVGSLACQQCHQAEYEKYTGTGHSHAYDALANQAKKPSLRNYDGECIVCHTVGFGYQTGYTDEAKTPQLKNVGCENCHGPGGAHAAMPKNPAYLASLSPWKQQPTDRLPTADRLAKPDQHTPAEKQVLQRVDAVCQKCHDTDNDPKYRFEGYWPKIDHSGLPKPVAAKR